MVDHNLVRYESDDSSLSRYCSDSVFLNETRLIQSHIPFTDYTNKGLLNTLKPVLFMVFNRQYSTMVSSVILLPLDKSMSGEYLGPMKNGAIRTENPTNLIQKLSSLSISADF